MERGFSTRYLTAEIQIQRSNRLIDQVGRATQRVENPRSIRHHSPFSFTGGTILGLG